MGGLRFAEKLNTILRSYLVNKRQQKNLWKTSETLDLVKEPRKKKQKNEYRVQQKKIQDAREEYLAYQCKEVELLEKGLEYFHMHKLNKKLLEATRIKEVKMFLTHKPSSVGNN